MPPKKKKTRRHDYRAEAGRFGKRPDQAPITSTSRPGGAINSVNPLRMPPQQQAWLAGHTPGWWISDHLEELRHFVSWIYVGVHKIAQQWAQSSVCVYDTSEEAYETAAEPFGRPKHLVAMAKYLRQQRRLVLKSQSPDEQAENETPVPDHPAALLLERPNPKTAGRVFRYQVACQLRLTGAAYIWEVPGAYQSSGMASGEPAALWCIPRGWVRPMAPNGQYQQGYYQVTPSFNTFTQGIASPSQSTYNIPFEQMINVAWPNPLYPGEGTSPLSACSQIIDIMEQTDTATWAGMVNSVKPSMVFNLDPRNQQTITQEHIDQLMTQIETLKSGSHNAGKILAMIGLTVQQMMSGPSELDYVNGRVQNRESVLATQGVAPIMTGLGGAGSYSEASVQAKAAVEFGISPDLDMYSDTLTHRWQPIWGDDFKIEHKAKAFDDPTLKLQRIPLIAAGHMAGVVSDNEYRAELDYEPLDDPIADIPKCLLMPMLPEIGAPETGVAGMGDAEDPYAAFGQVDTEEDMPTEDSTGQKNPLMQEASGNRKSFSLPGRNLWRFKAEDSGGRWITIGGEKGKDGKRKGGSPVFIKNGRITKGHPGLVGKRIDALSEPAEGGSHRSEMHQSRQYEIAKHRKAARKEGIDPKHLDQLAGEIKSHHDAFAAERKEVLQYARGHAKGSKFASLQGLQMRQERGAEDSDAIRGFDEVAADTQAAYPHHFHAETGVHGHHGDQLHAMLLAGNPKPMEHGHAYEQALEHLLSNRPAKEADYPAEWDKSFRSNGHMNGTH